MVLTEEEEVVDTATMVEDHLIIISVHNRVTHIRTKISHILETNLLIVVQYVKFVENLDILLLTAIT